jgi:hypothetical protein
MGLLLTLAGGGVLYLLSKLPSYLNLIMLISQAATDTIGGLALVAMGLLRLAVMLGVVALALVGLLLIVAGVMRLARSVAPGPARGR